MLFIQRLLAQLLTALNALKLRTDAAGLDGQSVTIDAYSASDYVFPADGYLFVACNAAYNASAFATIKDRNGTSIALVGCGNANGTYSAWSTYVKKGMRARTAEVANGGHVYFLPLK